MSDPEQTKLQKVLMGTELGDQKPSELLSKMKSLAGDNFNDEVLKTLWLQRLPNQVRAILAVSNDQTDKLAELGDKIIETLAYSNVSEVQVASCSFVPKGIEQQIETLTKRINELQRSVNRNSRSRSRSYSRESHSSRTKSKQSGNNYKKYNANKTSFCFYHWRFGENARKCNQPCDYTTKNGTASKN